MGEALVALLGYTALALSYLRATPERLWGAILPDLGDPLYVVYVLRWGARQIRLGLPDPWNATFFHPAEGALALSDHLFGPAALFALLEAAGLPPLAAYNFLLISAFALSALSLYLVARWSGCAFLPSVLAGFCFAFSSFRWAALSHLQVLLVAPVPLALWCFHRLLEQRSIRHAFAFAVCYGAVLSGGMYYAYLIHLPLAVMLAVWLARARHRAATVTEAATLAATALACASMAGALFLTYQQIRDAIGIETPTKWLFDNRISLASLLTVGIKSFFADLLPPVLRGETRALWPGLVPALTGLAAASAAARHARRTQPANWPRRNDYWILGLLAIAAAAVVAADLVTYDTTLTAERALRRYLRLGTVVLSCGVASWTLLARRGIFRSLSSWALALLASAVVCALAAHPSLFFLLAEGIPGWTSVRVTSRLGVFWSIPLLLFLARAVTGLRDRFRSAARHHLFVGGLLLLSVVEQVPRGALLTWHSLPQTGSIPLAYEWLSEQADTGAVVELPVLDSWQEAKRMYFATYHWHPLVNGYSGYLPPGYEERRQRLFDFPDGATSTWLEGLGVRYLLVHWDSLGMEDGAAGRAWLLEATDPVHGWLDHVLDDQADGITVCRLR